MSVPTAKELLDGLKKASSRLGVEERADTLAALVEKVLALHVEAAHEPDGPGWCAACERMLPCPTVRRLNGEEL